MPHEKGERCHQTKSNEKNHQVSLWTIPVVLENGGRKIDVNALLDDGSSCTYLSTAAASELGLEGSTEDIEVYVLSGAKKCLRRLWQKSDCEECHWRYQL